jgi:glycosyltransferase involved in cell wall biosynthesis
MTSSRPPGVGSRLAERAMLEQITPLVLTLNEGPNISRSLAQLEWAREVVIVDSFSTDDTLQRVAAFPNARVVQRTFDSHAEQWNFGLTQTGISTPWVLALDADFFLPEAARVEIASLDPASGTGGFEATFRYCIKGHPLRGAAYPPVTVLYRREDARYEQDGHTQRIRHAGACERLRNPLLHDDRKSLGQWIAAQSRYMRLEAEMIQGQRNALGWADRIRRTRVLGPPAMLFYCLVVRGGVLEGRAGWYYAFQRATAEMLLSLYLLEHDLKLDR